MNLLSWPVLGVAVLLASPALWASAEGAVPFTTAGTRLGVCLLLSWAALSAVAALVPAASRPVARDGGRADAADGAAPAPTLDMQRPADVDLG